MTDLVLVDIDEGIATVTLNRPEAMNALSRALLKAIVDTFKALKQNAAVDVVILTGAGRAFCAGVDLAELSETASTKQTEGLQEVSADAVRDAIEGFDRPIIGAINGHAIAGGFEIALMCDILIGSVNARFADTHARVGVVPGWGLSQKLSRILGISRAKELSLSGNFLLAEQAERWGLINRVVATDELLPQCRQLARDIQSCEKITLHRIKQVIDDGYAVSLGEGLQMEAAASAEHMQNVTGEAVAERREQIQARGRDQSSAAKRSSPHK